MKRIRRISNVFVLTLALLFSNIVGTGCSYDAVAKQKVKLDKKKVVLSIGTTTTVKVTGIAKGKKVTWSISDKKILKKVKSSGSSITVKAVNAGKSVIKAKISKKTYTCQITVEPSYVHSYKDHDKFASAVSDMIIAHPAKSGAATAATDMFYTGRLIVQGKRGDISFSDYKPTTVIKNDENTSIIQFENEADAKEAYQNIVKRSDVEWVEPDQYISANDAVTGKASGYDDFNSWGVELMGADVYAKNTSKDTLVVAVVDTGVSSHPFLSGRLVSGYDYVQNDSDPSDQNSHGTHVAGTVVDCTPGLNVKIMPVRVLDAGGYGTSSAIGLGIRYAADHGAKVINLSLGGTHTNYEDSCIQYALNKGVTVVCAAGNNSSNTSYFCPAHIGSIIVVAAIDDDEERAYFSNYGNSVDVAAPGVGILSSVPGGGYEYMQGTSMASPHIAAVAAMIKLNYPDSTPAQVEAMLKSCCRDLGTAGWDMYYGYGVPDLAHNEITPPGDTPTPTPTVKPTSAPVPTATPVVSGAPVPTPVTPTVPPYPTATPRPVPTTNPGGDTGNESGYKYRVDGGQTAVIIGYEGFGGRLSIPTELGGYPVSGIADGAFKNNSSIQSVTISGIIWIGDSAFEGCTGLGSLQIDGIISGVGSRAFANESSLSRITINGMVNQVQRDVFSDCGSLNSAYVNGIVDSTVVTALRNCPSLTNLQILGIVTG